MIVINVDIKQHNRVLSMYILSPSILVSNILVTNAPRATIGRQNALTAVKLSKAAQKLRHSTRIGRHVPLTSPKDLEVAIFVKKSAQSMQTSPKTLKVAIFQEVYNGLKSKKLHILLYKIAQYLREDCTFMGGNV